MDENLRIISTSKELEIFSNPFRLNIINVYRDYKEPLTVKGCADILHEFPSKVHYHVKKLLDINVLELDHIEVINGINAKYYKLTSTKFSVQIQKDTVNVVQKNVEHINNIMISQTEQFKMDFINMSQTAIKRSVEEPHNVGWFSLNNVYLSKEEFHELEKLVLDYINLHNEKMDNKNQYSMMFGIANKFKDEQ